MNPRAHLAITEAAGRTDLDDRAWLHGICLALRQSRPRALAVVGAWLTVDGGRMGLSDVIGDDAQAGLARQWLEALGQAAAGERFGLGAHAVGLRSELGDRLPCELAQAWISAGVVDALCLIVMLPDGRGVIFWTPETCKIDSRTIRQAASLSESIRVGLELRTVLGSRRLEETIGPVLEPAHGSHRSGAFLRAARLTRPDPGGCCEPVPASTPQSISPWIMLCRGFYRVIDQFDRDGRRYMVLVALDAPDPLRALSDLEQRIADLCGQAWGNKQIAYDIGSSESAVENHIGRILGKLRLDSRLSLVRLYTQLERSARVG